MKDKTRYYKATRPDGTSFQDRTTTWEVGEVTTHARSPKGWMKSEDAYDYLSVSVSPTDCTGFRWPARLFLVEPTGRKVVTPHKDSLPNKRASVAWRVVEELPASDLLGPQSMEIRELIRQARSITSQQAEELHAAWDATWGAARDAARYAARDAARDAARYAARYAARDAVGYAARDAVGALVVRDLIPDTQYQTLVKPWVSVMGDSFNV